MQVVGDVEFDGVSVVVSGLGGFAVGSQVLLDWDAGIGGGRMAGCFGKLFAPWEDWGLLRVRCGFEMSTLW